MYGYGFRSGKRGELALLDYYVLNYLVTIRPILIKYPYECYSSLFSPMRLAGQSAQLL